MNKVLVIAPHPDDETLGCGGTLLRHKSEGDLIFWLIMTCIDEVHGWSADQIRVRDKEIEKIADAYGFSEIHTLALPTAQLDTIPLTDIIEKIGSFIKNLEPEILYTPYAQDVHTDHQLTAKAVNACTKWYRYPSIKRVLAYETLSETESYISDETFKPNVFVNISKHLELKIEIMSIYASEFGDHPFPRSEKTIRALAELRGSQVGYIAAEAFQLLMDRS